jgi:hypothetical protein
VYHLLVNKSKNTKLILTCPYSILELDYTKVTKANMKLIQKQERVNGSVKNASRPSGAKLLYQHKTDIHSY